jgi:ribosomal protein S18 acetylase RimI-like enzyme
MATTPEARGRGLGRLVCLTALDDARRRGHAVAVLHSTPMAVGLYESIEFRARAGFGIYAEPGSVYA